MKYKIKVVKIDGEVMYIPKYKFFLFWHDIPPEDIELYRVTHGYDNNYYKSYASAVRFIDWHRDITAPEPEVEHIKDIMIG